MLAHDLCQEYGRERPAKPLQWSASAVVVFMAENSTGAPKGNQNALKHGRYTAEAIEERRVMSVLLRQCRAAMGNITP
jgi:hypothetical protein